MLPVQPNSHVQSSKVRQKEEEVNNFQIVEAQAPLCRINADNQQPQAVCLFWVLNFCVIILIFGLIFAVPQVVRLKSNEQAFKNHNHTCFNPIGFDQNDEIECLNFSSSNPKIGLIMSQITNLNQFAKLYFKMEVTHVQQQGFGINQNLTITINKLKIHRYSGNWKTRFSMDEKNIYSQVIQFKVTLEEFQQFIDNVKQERKNKRQQDDDDDDDDDDVYHFTALLGFDRQIQHHIKDQLAHYLLVVQAQKPNQIAQHSNSVQLKSVVVNEQNTIYIIVLRYVYLIISIFTATVFLIRYTKIPTQDKTIEQNYVAGISVLVFLFNDPFYAVTVLVPNGFSTFLSILFVATFIICLLSLIVVFLIRIFRDQGRREVVLEMWKKLAIFIYFLILFIFTIALYCMFAYHSMNQPILNIQFIYHQDFIGVLVTTFILISLGFLFIIVLYIAIICSCRTRNFMWRNILYLAYSTFYIIIIFIALYEFAFVPHNFMYQTEGTVLIAYSYCNIYVYVLQYMYYTPKKDLDEAIERQIRDNDAESNTIMSDINPLDLTSQNNVLKEKEPQQYYEEQN